MPDAFDVARLVRSNGGQLIGKTRLQKSAYFLEQFGAGFGFEFGYHHYGPYCEELASVTDDAHALHLLDIDWANSQAGTPYAIFRDKGAQLEGHPGADERRIQMLNILSRYSAVELELAATADYLANNGYGSNPWAETKRRKASKLTEQRMIEAKRLLQELMQFRQ